MIKKITYSLIIFAALAFMNGCGEEPPKQDKNETHIKSDKGPSVH